MTLTMDELMCEVTNQFLLNGNDNAGAKSEFEDEIRAALCNFSEPSSFNILRKSVIRSIKERQLDTKAGAHQCEEFKSRRYEDFRTPRVEVEFINQNESTVSPQSSSTSKNDAEENNSSHNENKFSKFVNSYLSYTQDIFNNSNCKDKSDNVPLKKFAEIGGTQKQIKSPPEDIHKLKTCKIVGENGLRLARRNSTENIFESCSTYSISCPEIILNRNHTMSCMHLGTSANSTDFNDLKASAFESESFVNTLFKTEENNEESTFTKETKSSDDPISLSDSFFPHIMNEENFKTPAPSAIQKNNFKFSDIKQMFPVDDKAKEVRSANFHNDNTQVNKKDKRPSDYGRISNKRARKRSRKNKSKSPPMYDCPKCGVSYQIPPNTVEDVVRCLYCDPWTPVDPVFVKRDKQAWNTCRIS